MVFVFKNDFQHKSLIKFTTKIFSSLFLIILISSSCKKNTEDQSNPTFVSIQDVNGTYKGGTLGWEKKVNNTVTKGTDPNFTFTAKVVNDKVTITLNTVAPISTKTWELPLTLKQEINNSMSAYGSYDFTYQLSALPNIISYEANFLLYKSPSYLFSAKFSFSNINSPNYEQISGSGNR